MNYHNEPENSPALSSTAAGPNTKLVHRSSAPVSLPGGAIFVSQNAELKSINMNGPAYE